MVDRAARWQVLFGDAGGPGPGWDDLDEGERLVLVEDVFGLTGAQGATQVVLLAQLLDGEPPFVWETLARLLDAGIELDGALGQLRMVLLSTMHDVIAGDEYDDDEYRRSRRCWTGWRQILMLTDGQWSMSWLGPDGWLDPYPVGSVLAVRVDDEEMVSIEVLADPPAVDPVVVELLRRVVEEEVDEPGMPVTAADVILGMLAEQPDVFDTVGAATPPADQASTMVDRRAAAWRAPATRSATTWAAEGRSTTRPTAWPHATTPASRSPVAATVRNTGSP
jgi:hypothetical protein